MDSQLTLAQRAQRKSRVLRRRYRARRRATGRETRSIYFYTFHKCASSLFASFVLPNVKHLEYVNYERKVYNGDIDENDVESVELHRDGHLYGPIRLSGGRGTPVARRLLDTVLLPEIADKIAVSLIRDPRDILVSRYFSFIHSHGDSPVARIAERQKKNKDRLIELGVDAYALESANEIRKDFEAIAQLQKDCKDSVVVRYEDMIDDFDLFLDGLTRYFAFEENIIEDIYRRSRPREKEDISSHKRSGRSGTYAQKLRDDTINELNQSLADVLDRFGYSGQR